jgi:ubiquinone/menaquinone biosynthesis C-methylase UbiE
MNRSHAEHYMAGALDAALDAALAQPHAVDTAYALEALAGLDQFHTGGLAATRMLAERAAIVAADRVLDIGGGLGGPARVLAHERGCQVTVVDLTEAYCRGGARLTAWAGLTDRVRFQHGDALALPYADQSFDVVWTQHSTMNIADKARLSAEIYRVLRPGGRLALFEVVAGSGAAIHFPAPWARSPSMSFLVTPAVLRTTLAKVGLREIAWRDTSAWALDWFAEQQQARANAAGSPSPVDLSLVLGPEFRTMVQNHRRNLQEERIRIVEGVLARQ